MLGRIKLTLLTLFAFMFGIWATAAEANLPLARGAISAAQNLVRAAEGQVTALKIDVLWGDTMLTGTDISASITDVGIEYNNTGTDYVYENMISFQSESTDLGLDNGIGVTGFDDLADCEYGAEDGRQVDSNYDAEWNDAALLLSDPSTYSEQSSRNFNGQNIAAWFKFCSEAITIERILLAAEHFNFNDGTDYDYFLENVVFTDQSSATITPTVIPLWKWDYVHRKYDTGAETASYAYEFETAAHPSPVVKSINIDIQYTSGSVVVRELGFGFDGERMVDVLSYVSANDNTTSITDFNQLSNGELGTSTTNSGDANMFDNVAHLAIEQGIDTGGLTFTSSQNKKILAKFNEGQALDYMLLSFDDTATNGNPQGNITITDEGGNTLLVVEDGFTNYSSAVKYTGTNDTNRSYVWIYGQYRALTETDPVRIALGEISGTNEVGETITVSDGTWVNDPSSYTYRVLRDSSPISGETSGNYTYTSADSGAYVQYEITAVNGSGSTVVKTAGQTVKPYWTANPTMSGTVETGSTVTCVATNLIGEDSINYVWQVDTGSGFSDIGGATSATYVPESANVGDDLRCGGSGTNDGGTNTIAYSSSQTIAEGVVTYSEIQIKIPPAGGLSARTWEILLYDAVDTEFLGGLTAVGESVTTFGGLSAGEYTSDSTVGADLTVAYIADGTPDFAVAFDARGFSEASVNSSTDLNIFVKPSSATSFCMARVAIRDDLTDYTDVVFTADGSPLTPIDYPTDGTDYDQTIGGAGNDERWYTYTFCN